MWKNNNELSKQFYNVKIMGIKEKKPEFVISQGFGDNYTEIARSREIFGKIIEVKNTPYEFQGKKKKAFTIKMQGEGPEDFNKVIVLQCAYNTIGKSIINTIATADFSKVIKMQVYTNKKGYPSIYITQEGKRLERKYSFEEIKKKIQVIEKRDGTKEYDDFDYVCDLENLIEEMQSKINQEKEKNKSNIERFLDNTEDDELPF